MIEQRKSNLTSLAQPDSPKGAMLPACLLSRISARAVKTVLRSVTPEKASPDMLHARSQSQRFPTIVCLSSTRTLRSFSTISEPSYSPEKLTADMAQGISDVTHFYIRHGLAQRRLQALAQEHSSTPNEGSVLQQWQSMIEIYLATQLHVLAGMGYASNEGTGISAANLQEHGLTKYAHDLASLLAETDEATRDAIVATRRESWRELVATAFGFDAEKDIPTLNVMEARELMHAVSSRMVEPDLLLMIQSQTAKVSGKFLSSNIALMSRVKSDLFLESDSDPEVELQKKHHILQEVIVNQVYLGVGEDGKKVKSITEQFGFGTGPEAYAKLQCAMSDHEGDPLIGQYAGSAMAKLFAAAGLDGLLGE